MITKSNPFLRNDYYPDQNDIDDLNTRINEVQSDVDLLAISVNEKTEAVNGRLNNLQDDYNESFKTEALKANTVDFNVLNVNVQATIKDLNAINTYTENLIVNKPVQDLSLRTPHLENTTSLNGNFYAPNIIGGKLDNIQFENIQNFKVVNIEADEVKANKLIGDFSAEPISSSAVVGYDENGQLIPIRASYDVSFPEDADYLKTDAQGTARKGISESAVVQSTNLIQAGAVQNMYSAINANIDTLKNVSGGFAKVFNNVFNSFNDVNENLNDIDSRLNNIESNVKTIDDFIFNGIYIPEYGSFNSDSPVNYRNATTVELYGNAQGGTATPNGDGLIKFDASTNKVTFGFSGACRGIKNAAYMFRYCTKLNQNILIPNSVEYSVGMFQQCGNLNQNILIPNSIKNAYSMFFGCSNLNQNILIPNSVEDAGYMFSQCGNLNQSIHIPPSVKQMEYMFAAATTKSLNQDIYIYSQNIVNMRNAFVNQDSLVYHKVHIPVSVPKRTSNYIYNCLVNNETGVTFAPENIYNDLPVDSVWPPVL